MAIEKYKDWETFVKLVREEINRFSTPANAMNEKSVPTWEEFVTDLRLRILLAGDEVLIKDVAEKDAVIADLKNRLSKAETTISNLQEKLEAQSETKKVESIDLDTIYMEQIKTAQAFLSGNRKADVSRIKDLFRRMLPAKFHTIIEKLTDSQDPHIINNFYASTQVLPNAITAEQIMS